MSSTERDSLPPVSSSSPPPPPSSEINPQDSTLKSKKTRTPKTKKLSQKGKVFKDAIKVIIRLLPPNLSEETFWNTIDSFTAPEKCYNKYFVHGHYSSKPFKSPSYSRAYIQFKNVRIADEFVNKYKDTAFEDDQESMIPQFTSSLYNRMPEIIEEKVNPKHVSLEDLPSYKLFLKYHNGEIEKPQTFLVQSGQVAKKLLSGKEKGKRLEVNGKFSQQQDIIGDKRKEPKSKDISKNAKDNKADKANEQKKLERKDKKKRQKKPKDTKVAQDVESQSSTDSKPSEKKNNKTVKPTEKPTEKSSDQLKSKPKPRRAKKNKEKESRENPTGAKDSKPQKKQVDFTTSSDASPNPKSQVKPKILKRSPLEKQKEPAGAKLVLKGTPVA